MTSEPIPNADPRCPCVLGEVHDGSAVFLYGPGTLVLSVYLHCPLHGETVQALVKSGLKGLSLEP